MAHIDDLLARLKVDIDEMWVLVIAQVSTAREALLNLDKMAANEVVYKEKIVDSMELKIDRDVESILALCNPVATDLRLTLAILKMNSNLERIADFARGIVRFISKFKKGKFNPDLLAASQVGDLMAIAIEMLNDCRIAFTNESTRMAISIIPRDEMIDEVARRANSIVADHIKKYPDEVEESLQLHSTLQKIERIGDHTVNIAEEIVFYLEAKVLKHASKKKSPKDV